MKQAVAKYGFEATVRFGSTLATSRETQAVDIASSDEVPLWRVSAFSSRAGIQQLTARLIYGTCSTIELIDLVCPLVAYVPGNVQLYLQPQTNPFVLGPMNGYVSARPVWSPGQQVVRSLADATAAAVNLPATAVSYTAYTASTLTVAGIGPIAVAVAETLRLIGPARLTAGTGIAEHDL